MTPREADLRALMADVFGVPVDDIGPDASIDTTRARRVARLAMTW